MSDPPTEEDLAREKLAESLVDEALEGFEGLLLPDELEDIRNYLVDELVCTSYGRERLRRLSALPTVLAGDEIVVDHAVLSKLKKDGSGS